MDNATNNTKMMEELETILKTRDIEFDAKDRRIMCFAHIINLCSGRVIHNLTDKADEAADKDGSPSSEPDHEIVPSNPIARARAVVQVIRGSGGRRDAFDELIKNGNDGKWFKRGKLPQVVQLKPLQLLRDVSTRWDSVYHMLRRLREIRPVCPYLTKSNAH